MRIIPVDVRIIATTNQNLEKAIQEKRFRQDLYYRLAVFNLHIPPLNQHPEDIPQIADYFVKRLCKNSVKIPDKHMKKLMKYPWPGNVRELRNVIERSSFLFSGDEIRPADLLLQHTDHFSPGKKEDPEKNLALEDIIPLEEMKKRYIKNALKASSGNKSLAARTLDISLSTLKRKLKEMGVS